MEQITQTRNIKIKNYYNKKIEQNRNQEIQHCDKLTRTGYVELYKYKILQERENEHCSEYTLCNSRDSLGKTKT
jgi:hypothetical protein